MAFFLFISAITGLLLGWKKDVSLIQPPSQKGITKDLSEWKPIEELAVTAKEKFYAAQPSYLGNEIDKIDVRPSKGIAKVIFENGWWEVQIDGKSGKVLSIARRHSDWIEQLHDGSIISDLFKLISMNLLGIGLAFIILSGIWLYYGPKQYRKLRRRKPE